MRIGETTPTRFAAVFWMPAREPTCPGVGAKYADSDHTLAAANVPQSYDEGRPVSAMPIDGDTTAERSPRRPSDRRPVGSS
jgi:hypothetical protein